MNSVFIFIRPLLVGVILIIQCTCFNFLQAQPSTSDTIIKKGYRFYLGEHKITRKELKTELQKFPESGNYYKKYKSQQLVGMALALPALFLFWKQQDPERSQTNTTGLTIGALGFTGAGLYFYLRGNRNLKRSVRKYNERVSY